MNYWGVALALALQRLTRLAVPPLSWLRAEMDAAAAPEMVKYKAPTAVYVGDSVID